MTPIVTSAEIGRPPAEVCAYATDPARAPTPKAPATISRSYPRRGRPAIALSRGLILTDAT
jgi:hypothetical protein